MVKSEFCFSFQRENLLLQMNWQSDELNPVANLSMFTIFPIVLSNEARLEKQLW